ncbi:unnamed protein product [Adineta ricciae]|uniref:Uncharacterized protein n=1 Tax=Adineta ricciae TaxID=249248 RepID=A0A814XA89_ADIRI|nr:unnamed protein product [Adineta ricciae]
MSKAAEPVDFNKSAYVALSCLIAFVIVITICVLKQFIWDPLLSNRFEILRPVLTESVHKLSASFYRTQSNGTSNVSLHRSLSEACVKPTDPPTNPSKTFITVTHSLPTNESQYDPINKNPPQRSYGSSLLNPYVYVNYAADDLHDEQTNTPTLQFSCEYNPTTFSIQLKIKSLRNLSIFQKAIKPNTSILVRFCLPKCQSNQTSARSFQDFVQFNEKFTILNHVHPGDTLNYNIKFSLILIIDDKTYDIAGANYLMKNDSLTYVLFVDKTIPMSLKLVESETK